MREIPRSRLGPGVLAGVRPNLRSCFCTRTLTELTDEASVQLLPQTTARRALSLGSVKSPAPGGNMRAMDGAGSPGSPQGSGGARGVGDTSGPLQAWSIPCARCPVRRWVLWPWALPPGVGALSPARPEMLPR
uniref:Uncharacterized protein n=1 Tax=Cebus imitator TaxID=2715852 RepID=A0A2K5QGH0_CEBIM